MPVAPAPTKPSHPLCRRVQEACLVCCDNLQCRHFSLMLSQGREKLLWSGCARKPKEQGLPFLLSQICWVLPVGMALGMEKGQLLRCLWPKGRGAPYGGGLGDARENRDFSSFPWELVLVYRRWKQDCVPHTVL